MTDSTTPQDHAAMSPASDGSVDAMSVLRKLVDGVRGMTYGDPYDPASVEASTIVRWAIDEIEQQRASIGRLCGLLEDAERNIDNAALTDAEREAIDTAAHAAVQLYPLTGVGLAAILRGLLERLGGQT